MVFPGQVFQSFNHYFIRAWAKKNKKEENEMTANDTINESVLIIKQQ